MVKKVKKAAKLSVYSNLASSKKAKKAAGARKSAQYLASLPKYSYKRILYHLSYKRFAAYWFNKQGAIKAAKILGVCALIMCLFVGGLFAYFRKDLDAIRPGELAKSVQSNVNTYLDRNGELLWQDKGDGNYKLVVESDKISKYLKQATVAIEDKDFYKHSGISISGLVRAAVNNFMGGSTQGGSTLTQQLVKQVFFSTESANRGLTGIPRKIKEVILAIEVERMYNKDQILTLYLNESPYGGRRNGAESGAKTYFGKSVSDLTLPEAALLAAIPQNPSVYDPYNVDGHAGLVRRQQAVLKNMASLGYITKDQADEAIKFPIIDHINPLSNQYADIRAPHFVEMVRSNLEKELGKAVVGKGGLTIKTTLDLRIQTKMEEGMNELFASQYPAQYGFSNGASTVEDVKTGQIIAMMGSRDYNYPGYGQDNAAVAYIQPGSSIKPLVYAELFSKRPAGQLNFGSGSILSDENIDAIYGAPVRNADGKLLGDITIRQSLATSRNIAAIKAEYISGVKKTLDTIHKMGVTSYCTQGDETTVGLASAIGGCGVKQIDLVNGYASIARQGAYIPQSSVLEVRDNTKKVLKKWVAPAPSQIVDPQAVYIVSDILTDAAARASLHGYAKGMAMDGIKTGTKTGTSDRNGYAKDLWMFSYSPALVMSVWVGNSDATILRSGNSSIPGAMIQKTMEYAHNEIYRPAGLWSTNQWFDQPSGIQRVDGQVYPSWWSKTQGQTLEKMKFDTVSKKKATAFTPANLIIELEVTKSIDPVTKKEIFIAPDGYDASKDDDIHLTDSEPTVTLKETITGPTKVGAVYNYSALITPTITSGNKGTATVTSVDFSLGTDTKSVTTAPYQYDYTAALLPQTLSVTATITDGTYTVTSDPLQISVPAWLTLVGTP